MVSVCRFRKGAYDGHLARALLDLSRRQRRSGKRLGAMRALVENPVAASRRPAPASPPSLPLTLPGRPEDGLPDTSSPYGEPDPRFEGGVPDTSTGLRAYISGGRASTDKSSAPHAGGQVDPVTSPLRITGPGHRTPTGGRDGGGPLPHGLEARTDIIRGTRPWPLVSRHQPSLPRRMNGNAFQNV